MTLFLAAVAFFFSGFAALVYQIVWQRLLVLPLGADVYSTTIVVAVFMAGLGIGSLAGGHIADRLSSARNLQLFVAAELAVGAFGFVSRFVLYNWHYLSLGAADLPQAAMVAIAFVSLLWPTFWMGVSLPVLGRAVSSEVSGAATRVGVLYGLNTLGAAAGAFLSTWIIMPLLGLDGAIRLAAAFNLIAAGSVLALLRPRQSAARTGSTALAETGAEARIQGTGWSFQTWAWLYGLSGFQALSLEILWFRLLGVMVKASAFTFGTLLTVYLAGLGLGAAIASIFVSRVRRPALAFLGLQAFVGLYAGLSITALVAMLEPGDVLTSLSSYFAGYEPLDASAAFASLLGNAGPASDRSRFLLLYVALPAVLVGPATIALGASFPFIQKLVLVDAAKLGRHVGVVMVANIAGSAAGSIACGWLALTWLGSATTLKALVIVSGGFLVLAVLAATVASRREWRAIGLGTAVAAAAIVAVTVPDETTLWAALHGSAPRLVVHKEDASGLSLIKTEVHTFGNRGIVFVNGIGQSWIPYGNIHSVLGALPAFVHPHPTSAALIGLGSGDTLYSLAGRPELTDLTSIEIIKPQIDTLQEWARLTGYPALTSLLSDPRIHHVYDDGRSFIMRSRRQYDIIEADALRPTSAYSGNLYSAGYFELVRSRLSASGLAVTWSPTSRIHDTFVSVFPHVLSFGDIVLGSNAPIAFDPDVIRERLRTPAVNAYFGRAAIDIEALLSPYLDRSPRTIAGGTGVPPDDLDEDLFPRDEFSVPRRR